MLESKDHAFSRFITLTYARDPGILDYRDFQLFMKRYRKEFGDVRFFCVGEYGGKTHRGHYHAILFGHAPKVRGFSMELREVWQHGFCYDGTVTKDSIGYVAGYCFKENYDEGKVPFVRMSLRPGIGLAKIREMGERAARLRLSMFPSTYRIGDKEYPLCGGGLVAFVDSYLESGGLPPSISNPVARDLRVAVRADADLGRGGTQLSEEANLSFNLDRRSKDESALKKER